MQLIRQFEVSTPGVRVEYTEFNTSELYPEIRRGDSPADVVISSAMDLQAKLVNSGLAHAFRPANAGNVPAWAQWRDEPYGFTFEPVGHGLQSRGICSKGTAAQTATRASASICWTTARTS
ncbi:MAG: substrate-binding domain-containing protein [Nitratireductor sp.]|uniref:substrate-binding domain-containing protein n=1 Tax=Nitratireductor rhodophyticola TaxID=2854036 RepID=UPI00300AFBCC